MQGMGYFSLIVSFVPRPSAGASTVLQLDKEILLNMFKILYVASSIQPKCFIKCIILILILKSLSIISKIKKAFLP